MAWLGPCIYIAGIALPFERDIPLLLLALVGLPTVVRSRGYGGSPLLRGCVIAFLAATVLSILTSTDTGRSLRLSAPLLPAAFLYFVIAEHFHPTRHTRFLYLTFSAVALGVASVLLGHWWMKGGRAPSDVVAGVGIPILVVPNDVTFLSLVAPLAIAVFCCERHAAPRLLAALSIVLSACAVVMLQSRVATLAMVGSITTAALLIRPRLALPCCLGMLALAVAADGSLGFPMAAKFRNLGDPRIPLWFAALSMFLEAPLFGQGAHTFGLLYRSYLHDFELPSWVAMESRMVPWPHNLYLELLAEQGLIGLAAFGALMVCGITLAWRTRRAGVKDVQILTAGAVAALIGLCAAAAVELTLLRQWVVIMIFVLLAVISRLSVYGTDTKEVHR